MRNGLNISGVSELVHEIQTKPEEAPITFDVVGEWRAPRSVLEVRTAHHGTIRMARGFPLEATSMTAREDRVPTPPEMALAALGACVLITHAHGYSARGISLMKLAVEVTGAFRSTRSGLGALASGALFEDLRYAIHVDCNGEDEQMKALSQFVTCFSPNHRAFIDVADYKLALEVTNGKGETAAPIAIDTGATGGDRKDARAGKGDSPVFTNRVRAKLVWEYGTQARAYTTLKSELKPGSREHTVTVDQSKQMIGLDSGPNPQELLLAAIVSELILGIADLAQQRNIPIESLVVESGGRLDIRGMLNAAPGIPARFHDIGFRVRATSDADRAAVASLVEEVARTSFGLCSLQNPYDIAVELHRGDASLLSFHSNGAQVEAFLRAAAEKQQELMNKKKAGGG